MNHWNILDVPEIISCIYVQMIFDECVKTIQWEKDSVFNKWYWENCKRMKLDTYILYIKINLNIRTKTVKLRRKHGKAL